MSSERIRRAYRRFDEANPAVMRHLARLARKQVARGRTKGSIKQLFEVLRWEVEVEGLPDVDEDFKLNNSYTALYARDLMRLYPELAGFFETRERRVWA